MNTEADAQKALAETRSWLDQVVIGLNLCPFARAPLLGGRLRMSVSAARDEAALLTDLDQELELLRGSNPEQIETSLLIHPYVLADFLDYNDFLAVAEALLASMKLRGELQIVGFHPDYRFADADADDPGNATNRSPHPMLHLLRESSVERALASIPDPDAIWRRNLELLRRRSNTIGQ